MKFTITREQLQEGLGAVAAAIPAKTTLPVPANVLVEASKQGGGGRGAQAGRSRGIRRLDRGEPADPERRPVGAAARSHADGGDEWSPPGQDGRARNRRLDGRSDRPTQGARAGPPALPG